MPSLLLSCNLWFWLSWHCCPSAFTAQRRWLPDTVACVGEGATFKPACKLYRMVAMTTGSTETPVPGRRCAHSSHFEKKILGIFFWKAGQPAEFLPQRSQRHEEAPPSGLLSAVTAWPHVWAPRCRFYTHSWCKARHQDAKFRLIALTAC